MGFLDRLLGRLSGRSGESFPGGTGRPGFPGHQRRPHGGGGGQAPGGMTADEQAVRRYQYLLKTAPPDQIERAHAEAFAALTPTQRQQVLQQLSDLDPHERPTDDSPASLARAATRMEMRQPGSLNRAFGGGMGRLGGRSMGMGIGGALLASVAGAFVGSAVANELFDDDGFMDWDTDGDAGGQDLADAGGYESGGYDGGDQGFGGFDSGFGGGDFGGGDFGGGDF